MSSAVTPRTAGTVSPQSGSTALAAPGGQGAVGAVNVSMVRMLALLDQALKAFKILEEVGADLRQEATVTEEVANYLTASFGERISLEQVRTIAQMLTQIVEGSLTVVQQGNDAVRAALLANFKVQVAQEALHSLGADGAYIDSQRRAG